MKKPKKTTATKPPSGQAVSDSPKARANLPKAESPDTSEKIAAKKTRKKPIVEQQEVTPPAVQMKASEEAKTSKPVAKTKRISKTKAVAATNPVLTQEPLPESLPTIAAPTAKVKRTAKTKIITAKPTADLTEPAVEPAKPVIAPAPASVTAPVAKAKRAKVKTIIAQPAIETKPIAEPTQPIDPQPAATQEAPTAKTPPIVKAKPSPKPSAKIKSVAKPEAAAASPEPTVTPKPISAASTPVEKPAPQPAILEAKHASRPSRKTPSRIPPILLEGDKPGPAPAAGPGQRYALGPKAPVEKLKTEGELPASYGTGTILLTARDPHWLYTHWDLSDDQQRRYNAFSRDGHLVVRIYIDAIEGKPVAEINVHPESRHWFVHVERANTRYVAQLGYYSAAERWTPVSTSAATLTPPDAVSADTSAVFGTIPLEVPMDKLLSLVKDAVQENPPLAQALQELRAAGHDELPEITPQPQESRGFSHPPAPQHARSVRTAPEVEMRRGKKRAPWKPSEWTPAQERALAEVVSMDQVRRVWMGSLEITELIRRQFERELGSINAAELGGAAPTSPAGAITGLSSPTVKGEKPKGFWFNVNAELIVYGATEGDATVTIGGRKIKLRRDGSFSYRFALPDGDYEMPVVAVSADGTDGRAADLEFSRHTDYRGDVGTHPQDPALQKLLLENF